MPRPLDPRWNSKESLLASITKLVRDNHCEIERLGSGDTFAIKHGSTSSIIIALKESGKNQPTNSEGSHHWIGVPNAFLDKFLQLLGEKKIAGLLFFLIDYWDQHLITIPGGPALRTILERYKKGPNLHLSFNVKKTGSGYSLVTARSDPEIHLPHIDTL